MSHAFGACRSDREPELCENCELREQVAKLTEERYAAKEWNKTWAATADKVEAERDAAQSRADKFERGFREMESHLAHETTASGKLRKDLHEAQARAAQFESESNTLRAYPQDPVELGSTTQRPAGDDMAPTEEDPAPHKITCPCCGAPYQQDGWCDVVIPNNLWKEVFPEDGMYCFRCIVRRLSGAGKRDVPIVWIDAPFADVERERERLQARAAQAEKELAQERAFHESTVQCLGRYKTRLDVAKQRVQELEAALRSIAFHLPIIVAGKGQARYVDIGEVFRLKRMAADAIEGRNPKSANEEPNKTKSTPEAK